MRSLKKNKERVRSPYRPVKIWAVVTAFVLVLTIVANYVCLNLVPGLLDVVFGGERPVFADGAVSMYPAATTSKQDAFTAAQKANLAAAEEGFVLLKNENTALPLAKGAKVSVFGKNSVNLSYGGSGSGGFDTSGNRDLFASLEDAGFQINETLKSFYLDNNASGPERAANSSDLDSGGNQVLATAETPQSMYTSAVKASYGSYSDAAIVVITRIGGEGFDLPRYQGNTKGAAAPDAHYLELDQNEIDLLTAVCSENFSHVFVIFNIPSSFEAPFLKDPAFDKIDAALWIGFTGSNGIMALGEIMNGSVNPSGRLVDTWAADFAANPAFYNFGTGAEADSTDKYDGGMYYSVDYEEGIYVGYRYYETRGYTDGEDWYNANVVYPFGYGLSYTTFDWQVEPAAKTDITKDGTIDLNVKVTNSGKVEGKEVVEVYASAPYSEGGIEKAHKVLVGYAKTGMLKPGASETVKISVDPYNMASYDYRDANENGFCGYELEAGNYTLYVGRNAHQEEAAIVCTLADDIWWDTDPVTGNPVENQFTDAAFLDSDWQLDKILSRADWEGTWPTAQTAETHKGTDRLYAELKDQEHNNSTDFDAQEYPWFDEQTTLTLRSMLPAETPEQTYNAIVDYNDPMWDELLNACNDAEIADLINNGAYHTVSMERVGLPATIHGDGPGGFTCFMNKMQINGTCQYVSEPVLAATWNVDLINEIGEAMGEEGAIGDPASGQPYSSIYAPGVNIHRTPFGGRCSEYFSEDPFLSGMMAAYEIRGLQSKGVLPMLKHFAANEQETHRSINGDCSWMTEQSLREIYLKSFELAVKNGSCRGVMSSFNRIGTRWTGGDYRLLTTILRDEWGFKGCVICDFNTVPQYMIPKQMYYAGGDLDLATTFNAMWTDSDSSETGDALVLRRAAKNVMYSLVNSNAMNAEVIGYERPAWQDWLTYIDIGIAALLVLSGAACFAKAAKAKRKSSAAAQK